MEHKEHEHKHAEHNEHKRTEHAHTEHKHAGHATDAGHKKALYYAMIVLVLLTLAVSTIQAFQISDVQEKVSAANGVVAAPSSSAPAVRSAPASAPTMVGGC